MVVLCMVAAFIIVSSSVGDGLIFVGSCVNIFATGWCTSSSVGSYSVGWDLVIWKMFAGEMASSRLVCWPLLALAAFSKVLWVWLSAGYAVVLCMIVSCIVRRSIRKKIVSRYAFVHTLTFLAIGEAIMCPRAQTALVDVL